MIQKLKIFLVILALLIGMYCNYVAALPQENETSVRQRDPSWNLLFEQNRLENEGKALEESFQFELAKEKYKQAIEIGKRMTPRQDYGRPASYYARLLQKQTRYEEALKEMSDLSEVASQNEYFSDRKKELESLAEARNVNNDSPVRQYIKSIKEKYAAGMPPKGTGDVTRNTTILRLYDVIADYDAGIKFIDEAMVILKKKSEARHEDFSIYDRIKTSTQAEKCAGLDKKPKDRGRDAMACKLIRDFFLVREGFEQDKAEGRKSCISAKPDEICMGRATKALIASDYFTW